MVLAPPKRTTQTKRQSTKKRRGAIGRQPDLFSSAMQQPYTPLKSNGATNGTTKLTAKTGSYRRPVFTNKREWPADKPAIPPILTIPEPAPYSGELQSFHRNDCLVVDNGWVGYLQDVDKEDKKAIFHPLQLPSAQKARAEAYIAVRDVISTCTKKKLKSRPNTRKNGKP
jgi:hypothetical protein